MAPTAQKRGGKFCPFGQACSRPPLQARAIILQGTLSRFIQIGRLTIIEPDGERMCFGEVPAEEHHLDVIVRLKGRLTSAKLTINPGFYLGECYMDGTLVIEQGTLWDLLDIFGRNLEREKEREQNWIAGAAMAILRRLMQSNSVCTARRNVAHHYDLSYLLYQQFLDADLQYSCAYFRDPTESLDSAQDAKKKHIAAKLLLEPDQRVLDIGCGWGGLALSLAQAARVQVVGVTLSCEQLVIAQQRGHQPGLDQRVKFELLDYREIKGKFDRIVSVGMFEHVGSPQYSQFFDTISHLLNDDGVAVIHSIGRKDGPDVTNAWIRRYIFPGGYIPALSEVIPAIERAGLWITDLEILRLHYAQTLRHWRKRFLANRRKLSELYDEHFCRMWEFYLAVSEMSFRYGGLMVFQAQLTRQIDTVPLTRDYLFEREKSVQAALAAE
jgi:cyclopropane-fatty-acyl-phospholipid synthase